MFYEAGVGIDDCQLGNTFDFEGPHELLSALPFEGDGCKRVVVGGGFIANELAASIRENYPDLNL